MKSILFVLFSFFIACLFIPNNYAQTNDNNDGKVVMHRYLVERTFPDGLYIPVNAEGSEICLTVVSTNAEDNVSWVAFVCNYG